MSGKINVLLISYHFSPCNTIGAIRPTKITKYLSKDIYNIDVICASPSCKDRSNVLQISDNIKVYYVGDSKKNDEYSSDNLGTSDHSVKTSSTLLQQIVPNSLKRHGAQIKHYKKELVFVDNFEQLIISEPISSKKYNFVISSSGPISSLLYAIKAKKSFLMLIGLMTLETR